MVVFQFANDIRADKKVCYTLSRCPHRLAAKDATLSRWISRVRIPLGAPFETRSPLPSRWRAFFYPNAGIRTRQGAELRKREAFSSAARKERSDAAKAGGASRTRISRWGHHLKREARYPRGDGLFSTQRRDSNPTGCGPRLNTVTICWLCPTRRTECRRRSEPASSRRPRSPPWHPRRHAAYP